MTTTEVSRAEKSRVIAERVMGHKIISGHPHVGMGMFQADKWVHFIGDEGKQPRPIPDYFTDPAAMVGVMEKTRATLTDAGMGWTAFVYVSRGWVCATGLTPMEAVAEAAYAYAMTLPAAG